MHGKGPHPAEDRSAYMRYNKVPGASLTTPQQTRHEQALSSTPLRDIIRVI
jgi:hypothetical protein